MSGSLFWRFLNFSRNGALAWVGVVLVYVFILFYFYNSVGQAEFLRNYFQIVEGMPEGMKQLIGLQDIASLGGTELIGIEVYLNMEYLTWLPLLLSVYAVFFGAGLVARDAERGVLEFLLAQPVRRSQVVLYKFLAFLVALAAILAASVVGVLVGARAIGVGLDLGNLLLAHLQVYLLVVAVAAYASLFSVLYLNTGRALMVSGIITAGMYILNFVGPALGSFQWLQRGSFFHYFQGVPLLLEGRLHVAGLALHVGAALVVLAAAVWLFERRDIVPG